MNKDSFKNQLTKTITAEQYRTAKAEQKEKAENINKMLDQANEMLFEQMKRLKELDTSKKRISRNRNTKRKCFI